MQTLQRRKWKEKKGKCFHQVYLLGYRIPAWSCFCRHSGKQVTVCYHGIAPGAEAALPFLPLGQVPFPYQTTMHGAGRGAVSVLFCTYHCLSGVKGIGDKQDKSLKVWMHCHPILFWMLSSWKSFDAPKGQQSCPTLGQASSLKYQRRKSDPGRGHLNLSSASQNKMRQQLNSCKIINRVSHPFLNTQYRAYLLQHHPHPHRHTHTRSMSSFENLGGRNVCHTHKL